MLAISTSWFYTTQHFMTDFSSVFSASSFFFFNFSLLLLPLWWLFAVSGFWWFSGRPSSGESLP